MDFDSLPKDVRFVFVLMMQAALKLKEMGQNKKSFVSFAEETWKSMEMNNEEELRETLTSVVMTEVIKFSEEKK
jgi:hypothetical protein